MVPSIAGWPALGAVDDVDFRVQLRQDFLVGIVHHVEHEPSGHIPELRELDALGILRSRNASGRQDHQRHGAEPCQNARLAVVRYGPCWCHCRRATAKMTPNGWL